MMRLKWFNAREAADLGVALADQFAAAAALRTAPVRGSEGTRKEHASALEQLHERADREVRPLELNFYQKARFANAFKWKLIENGVQRNVADDVTQSLIVHLAQGVAADRPVGVQGSQSNDNGKTKTLLASAKKAFEAGDYAQAVELFDEFVSLVPASADAAQVCITIVSRARYLTDGTPGGPRP